MSLSVHAEAYSMRIHDFVVIHLSSQNINACMHFLRICSFSRENQRIAC